MNSIKNRLLVAAALATAFGAIPVKGDVFTTCGVDLGAAGRTKSWAVFTLGQDSHSLKDGKTPKDGKNDAKDELSGSSKVIGDFGMGGSGNIKIDGHALIRGDLYYHQPGKIDKEDKARITGVIHHDDATDALLDQAGMDALHASDFAAGLATSSQFRSMREINLNDHDSLTITGDGCTVLSLKNFKLTGDSVLTLTGTTGTAFVINVSSQFKLTGNSQIVLAGGLTAADVLFNVRGTSGPVELSGKTIVNGIILAAKRDFHMSGSSMVFGEVIANTIKMDGGSKITGTVSPSTNP